MPCDVEALGGVDRGRIPAVAESQDARVRRHQVDDHGALPPATERCSLRRVLHQPEPTQAVGEPGVLRVRRDVHDGVDIPRRADAAGSRIREEEAGRASADEDEFIENGRQQTDDGLEERAIGINHAAASAAAR